eukprot:jgi/Psemu1/309292/fgenesh1_kg.497_\
MAVHSFHVFDRKGQTLFTKRYGSKASSSEDPEQLSEQRKLVFGMLFSLRELSSSLSPVDGPGDLQLVKTGASVLYHYETVSGLRFVLYSSTPEYHQGRQRHASIGSGSGTPGSATSSGNSNNNNNIGGSGSGGSSSHGGSSGGVAAAGGGGDNTAGSSSALFRRPTLPGASEWASGSPITAPAPVPRRWTPRKCGPPCATSTKPC